MENKQNKTREADKEFMSSMDYRFVKEVVDGFFRELQEENKNNKNKGLQE